MLTAIALAAVLQVATAAEIYKCQAASGKVEYRDQPCDGGSGEKIDTKDNSVGTGKDLATIRTQDAEFTARQAAKQKAIDKANADDYWFRERQWQLERAHQDSIAIEQAIRDGNTPYYYPAYPYAQRPKKAIVDVVPAKKLEPPPSVPAKPKYPVLP